jgi:hypothetical protein
MSNKEEKRMKTRTGRGIGRIRQREGNKVFGTEQ